MTDTASGSIGHEDARRPEYSGSWRVASEVLDLATLCDVLGEPTRGHSRGELVSPARSDARRPQSQWSLDSGLARTEPLEAHVEALVAAVDTRRGGLARIRSDVTTDLFCGVFRHDQWVAAKPAAMIVFGCGFVLSPALLARLAALEIPLSCDVY